MQQLHPRLIQDERAAAWACPTMRDRCLLVRIKRHAAHACTRRVLRRSARLLCAQETSWPRFCTGLRAGEVPPRFTPGSRSYRYTARGRGGPVLATPFSGRFPMSTEAAEHHEHAARHHKEAAKHHKAGSHEKAAHHAHTARGHHEQATHHASEAAKAHTEEHGHK